MKLYNTRIVDTSLCARERVMERDEASARYMKNIDAREKHNYWMRLHINHTAYTYTYIEAIPKNTAPFSYTEYVFGVIGNDDGNGGGEDNDDYNGSSRSNTNRDDSTMTAK